MFNKTMTMEVAKNSNNVGDILYINEERWIVEYVEHKYHSHIIHCVPLADYISHMNYINIDNVRMTIADYIESICDEYEENCAN